MPNRIFLTSTFFLFLSLLWFNIFGQTFDVVNNDQIRFDQAQNTSKFVAYDGEFYCVTYKGYSRINFELYQFTDQWELITPSIPGSSSFTPVDIHEHDGVFYFVGMEGIIIKDQGSSSYITPSNSNLPDSIYKMYVDDDIMVVISEDSLSYKLDGQSNWTKLSIEPFFPGSSGIILDYFDNPLYANGKIHFAGKVFDITTNDIKEEGHIMSKYSKLEEDAVSVYIGEVPKIHIEDSSYYIGNTGICAIGVTQTTYMNNYGRSIFNDQNGNVYYTNRDSYDPLALNIITPTKYHHGVALPMDASSSLFFCYDRATDSLYEFSTGSSFKLSEYLDASASQLQNAVHLDVNNVSTPVRNDGTLFFDLRGREDLYSVPKEECKSPLFAGGLWIGGQDDTAGLHLAAMTYRQRGTDYWPGPLDENDGSFNPQDSVIYNRVWKVNKEDVKKHIQLFNTNGSVAQKDIPESILNWPGNRASGGLLAPFIDLNADGIYQPTQGDYPDVPGDQCVYWVMNDLADEHGETGGLPLGVEVHCFAYAYYCSSIDPSDPEYVLNNTTFYRFLVVNRSANDYSNSIMSIWTDNDIGYFADDYVGCHVLQNFGYGFNGDGYDEFGMGYGENAPMQSNLFLKAPGSKHDGLDGDGDGDTDEDDEIRTLGRFIYYNNNTNPINGNPNTPIQFYNYQRARWMNGSLVEYGGNGITSTNGTKADYMFPGSTDPSHPNESWTEKSSLNTASDRRYISSTFDFDFATGDSVELEIAMVYTHDPSQYDQLPWHLNSISTIKEWYYQGGTPSCFNAASIEPINSEQQQIIVYPVPVNNTFFVRADSMIQKVRVLTINGQTIFSSDASSQEVEIPAAKLISGVYLVEVHTEHGVFCKKIVKL